MDSQYTIMWCLYYANRMYYIKTFLLSIITTTLQLFSPFIIKFTIDYIDPTSGSTLTRNQAFYLAILMFLTNVSNTIITAQI